MSRLWMHNLYYLYEHVFWILIEFSCDEEKPPPIVVRKYDNEIGTNAEHISWWRYTHQFKQYTNDSFTSHTRISV